MKEKAFVLLSGADVRLNKRNALDVPFSKILDKNGIKKLQKSIDNKNDI